MGDKAIALEAYFRLAQNTEAERQACEIRLRAERKSGELLRKMEKARAATMPVAILQMVVRSDNQARRKRSLTSALVGINPLGGKS